MRVRVHRRLVFPMRSGRYSTGVTCKAARRAAAWQKSNCCKSRISSYLERYSYELLCMETAKTVTDDDRERVRTFYSFAHPLSVIPRRPRLKSLYTSSYAFSIGRQCGETENGTLVGKPGLRAALAADATLRYSYLHTG